MTPETMSRLQEAEGRRLDSFASRHAESGYWYFRMLEAERDGLGINHDEVTPEIHVGSIPVSVEDFDHIKESGFGAILDLCGNNQNEAKEAKKRGIKYLCVKVHDGYSPSQEQFKAIVGYLKRCVKRGLKVYVHCFAGAGRAPTSVIAYLIASGVPLEEAIMTLKKKRRFHIVSRNQIFGLSVYEQGLAEGRA